MKANLHLLVACVFFVFAGCSQSQNDEYLPSIASLSNNETLVMKYRACHWRCLKGVVKFKNGHAIFGNKSLELSAKEIIDLDNYFLLGKSREEGWRCSLPIEISFKKMKTIRTMHSKGVQVFPCHFGDVNTIVPDELVRHFTDTPEGTPYWRLSVEEQNKRHTLIEPAEK